MEKISYQYQRYIHKIINTGMKKCAEGKKNLLGAQAVGYFRITDRRFTFKDKQTTQTVSYAYNYT